MSGEQVLVWNGVVARIPALVVQPTSAQDVAAAVAFARDHGLLLRIKEENDESVAERAVTVDLSRLRDC